MYFIRLSNTIFRPYLLNGINTVTKSLEKNEVSAILLSSDINPQFMVKHVIDLAVLLSVPVLVVNNLRKTLLDITGISSACFSIKNFNGSEPSLAKICNTIRDIAKDYPVPVNHINYNRREKLEAFLASTKKTEHGNTEIHKVDPSGDSTSAGQNNRVNNDLIVLEKDVESVEEDEGMSVDENSDDNEDGTSFENSPNTAKKFDLRNIKIPVEAFLMQRTSESERVFQPELSKAAKEVSLQNKLNESGDFFAFDTTAGVRNETSDFMEFSDGGSGVKAQAKPSSKAYKSLKVKRVRNNKDRGKRKIEMLKKQSEQKRYFLK